ncbi:MAG: hypothetical protein HKN76_12490, partial [Saprospiraceae bacterium]|nr:hypothetical protein [Saprospiraceae bacterium]
MAKRKKIIVIFDIGEAWKRHFILDSSLQVLESDKVPIVSTEDDEGDKAGNLERATSWVVKTIAKVESMRTYDLRGFNFTCSSTTLVHIGHKGDPIFPLFSTKKAFPHSLYKDFEYRHNQHKLHPIETGSPGVGMVNSGFQMFWLKYRRPYLYGQIRHSLHLPQYFSFLFTGIPLSDFTSIGCHSAMWNFQQKSMHNWVTEENIDKKLAPLVTSWHTVN